jgi:hypothetical protein
MMDALLDHVQKLQQVVLYEIEQLLMPLVLQGWKWKLTFVYPPTWYFLLVLSNRICSALLFRTTSTPMLASTSPPRITPLTVKRERTYGMICSGQPMMVAMF